MEFYFEILEFVDIQNDDRFTDGQFIEHKIFLWNHYLFMAKFKFKFGGETIKKVNCLFKQTLFRLLFRTL